MPRRKNPSRVLMRRTTIDLPLLMSEAFRSAAYSGAIERGEPLNGMFQRFIQEAIEVKLSALKRPDGTPYWPPLPASVHPVRARPAPLPDEREELLDEDDGSRDEFNPDEPDIRDTLESIGPEDDII